jgi:internalin A
MNPVSGLALQLIAENKRFRATFLDLGNCELTEVPAQVGELVWLEALSLANEWHEWDGRTWQEEKSRNSGARNNGSMDVGPLGGLTNLRSLIVSQIAELALLAALTKLEILTVVDARVSDLAPLAGLSALQTLYVSDTQVTDLAPLAGLSALQNLSVSGTQVTDLAPLAGLSALQNLNVYSTKVTDLSALVPLIRRGCPVRWSSMPWEGDGIYVEDCPLTTPPLRS